MNDKGFQYLSVDPVYDQAKDDAVADRYINEMRRSKIAPVPYDPNRLWTTLDQFYPNALEADKRLREELKLVNEIAREEALERVTVSRKSRVDLANMEVVQKAIHEEVALIRTQYRTLLMALFDVAQEVDDMYGVLTEAQPAMPDEVKPVILELRRWVAGLQRKLSDIATNGGGGT